MKWARAFVMDFESGRTRSQKTSIAYPIYDLATLVTLLAPVAAGVAIANDRFLSAAVLCIVLVVVDMAALFVGRLCRVRLMDYFRST